MGYLTNEDFKKISKHYCWICKSYMSEPYEFRVVIGKLVILIPVCFEHFDLLKKNKILRVSDYNDKRNKQIEEANKHAHERIFRGEFDNE